jgi:hypothetical protein
MSSASPTSVVALAGRRIDPEPTAQSRFPFDHVEPVRNRIAARLREVRANALVCSAACGADLIALDVAQKMQLRTRIVLPFSVTRFRATSVVDRPRAKFWGDIFDRVTAQARSRGDVAELGGASSDDIAYAAATAVILEEAKKLADAAKPPSNLVALVVWEGATRGPSDQSEVFAELARKSGFQVEEILTTNEATPRQ